MSNIVLSNTIVSGNRVEFAYTFPKHWEKYMPDPSERLFFEYDFDISFIPKSILNILFVSNVLVLSMFEGSTIYVEELDKKFYESIPNILDGYRKCYPDRDFSCTINCVNLRDNSYAPTDKKILAFTGGVDATSAMASHFNENLVLVNIWGGDIRLDNDYRYLSHKNYFAVLSKSFNFDFKSIKSNFRFLYDDQLIPHGLSQDWWAAIAHSLLIATAFSPIAYHLHAERIYLASSYTVEELYLREIATCNRIEIINSIAFASCCAEQCDPHLTRIEKVNNIVDILGNLNCNIQILACWNHQKDSITNCCRCEKCARTIMNIKACKVDPSIFGFTTDPETYAYIKNLVLTSRYLPLEMWKEIQHSFRRNKKYWRKDNNVNFILRARINNPKKPGIILRSYWAFRGFAGRMKRRMVRIIK